MIVLDASVILKWILEEEGEDSSKQYREKHVSGEEIIAVPDLFFYEVANVLVTKTRLPLKEAMKAFLLLLNFEFEIFSFGQDEFLTEMALSKKYGISLYDATYISFARQLKCPYVTADRKLYQRVRGLKEVRLL